MNTSLRALFLGSALLACAACTSGTPPAETGTGSLNTSDSGSEMISSSSLSSVESSGALLSESGGMAVSSTSTQDQAGIYKSATYTYEIHYPANTDIGPSINPAGGTSFTIHSGLPKGTTLNEAMVSVVAAPRTCLPPDIGQITSHSTETINGIAFNVVQGSDVGAGNLYESRVYDATKNGTCYQITELVHSCNLGVDCGDSHNKAFDHDMVFAVLHELTKTFVVTK